jgi:hypothetical protein
MLPKHASEFCELQDEALRLLRAGATRRGYVREIQALLLPAVEHNRSYEIMLSRGAGTSALAVRTTWRRQIDIEKFRDPVVRLSHGVGMRLRPTIEEVDVQLVTDPVASLLSRAAALAVPPHILNSSFGLDGISYELVFGQSFVQSRFRWWCRTPTGWEPLAAMLQEIETLVDNAIASR